MEMQYVQHGKASSREIIYIDIFRKIRVVFLQKRESCSCEEFSLLERHSCYLIVNNAKTTS